MKTITKGRITKVKEGRKTIFEILAGKDGKFHSFSHGLGICSYRNSIQECITDTIAKIDFINEDSKKRFITI